MSAASQPPTPRPADAVSLPLASDVAISSAVLLAGRSSITIDHQGVRYMLRATRNGKLILTK